MYHLTRKGSCTVIDLYELSGLIHSNEFTRTSKYTSSWPVIFSSKWEMIWPKDLCNENFCRTRITSKGQYWVPCVNYRPT